MNSVVFLEWFENQLMPGLKNHSLVVLDNASYHNVKTEDTVYLNFGQTKAVPTFDWARNTISHPSIKPSLRVTACKTIKHLPLPEGIFWASDPLFGSHI
jgi:hypothetical protein